MSSGDPVDDQLSTLVPVCCSFPVTGKRAFWQDVYLCHTCHPLPGPPVIPTHSRIKRRGSRSMSGDGDHYTVTGSSYGEPDANGLFGVDDDPLLERPGVALGGAVPVESIQSKLFGLCTACAKDCHKALGHNVEYLGTGMSYCDCSSNFSCTIIEKSEKTVAELWPQFDYYVKKTRGEVEAEKAAASAEKEPKKGDESEADKKEDFDPNEEVTVFVAHPPPTPRIPEEEKEGEDEDYMRAIHAIPQLLDNSTVAKELVSQAEALAGLSKETFWISGKDISNSESTGSFCALERLARQIAANHIQNYEVDDSNKIVVKGEAKEGENEETEWMGVEWWVQVKPCEPLPKPEPGASMGVLSKVGKGDHAIDLHYDKDEVLAEKFGLGVFPQLSTVTYLTESTCFTPTVVFPQRYHHANPSDCLLHLMSHMWVCHPVTGKHVVFDGSILHGSPAHYALRRDPYASVEGLQRVTLLVNLWKGHQPGNVKPLPSEIREKLIGLEKDSAEFTVEASADVGALKEETFAMNKEEDMPASLRGRIGLPFVGKGTTWETTEHAEGQSIDDEYDGDMVLVTFPPKPTENDTLLMEFGTGLQAYLDYDEDEDFDVGAEDVADAKADD